MNFETIHALLEQRKYPQMLEALLSLQIADIADFLDELEGKTTLLVFRMLPKEIAADVFSYLSTESQAELSGLVNEQELENILRDLYFDDKIDYLEEMPANVVKKILKNAPYTERKLINQFLNYPEDSAGSIMTIEFVDLKKEMTVAQALEKIRRNAPDKETIYTCYVTDGRRHLEGIISLKNLVIAQPEETIESIMKQNMVSVLTTDDKEDVAELIKKYDLLAIPVTDHENRLVGIITIDDIVDVIEEENTEDFHKMATVGKLNVSLLDASPLLLIRSRLPWLMILIFVNVFSGAGLAYFESTIQSLIALVFFLPLLIGSAGNAGSQSATLMIRAIALGDVEMGDWFRLLKKELLVALLMGIIMGVLTAVIGFFRGGVQVSAIVAISMMVVVLFGSLVGMSLPFVFNKLDMDPATASGPLVTSIADISGILIYFSIATAFLSR